MRTPVADVLAGEYESGYFGERLSILDIGANVGAFALWANLRWVQSMIHAYEPHPNTFALLCKNVARFPNVQCHNVAIAPIEQSHSLLYSRYDGDGEAALVTYAHKTFSALEPHNVFEVPVIHPRTLPPCDILKIDVEGAEADILQGMDLKPVSLILLEYQDSANRQAIKDLLKTDFSLAYEDEFAWSEIMPHERYRQELADDQYGHLFFVHRRQTKLRKLPASIPSRRPIEMSLSQLLAAASRVIRQRLARRLSNLLSRP